MLAEQEAIDSGIEPARTRDLRHCIERAKIVFFIYHISTYTI
jgi:hypothetical protein